MRRGRGGDCANSTISASRPPANDCGVGVRCLVAADGSRLLVGGEETVGRGRPRCCAFGCRRGRSSLAPEDAVVRCSREPAGDAPRHSSASLFTADEVPRPTARTAVARTVARPRPEDRLLSGDHRTTAEAVARASASTRQSAEATPSQKLDRGAVACQGSGERTAMVGDGINDAPALGRPTSASPSAMGPTRRSKRPTWCSPRRFARPSPVISSPRAGAAAPRDSAEFILGPSRTTSSSFRPPAGLPAVWLETSWRCRRSSPRPRWPRAASRS